MSLTEMAMVRVSSLSKENFNLNVVFIHIGGFLSAYLKPRLHIHGFLYDSPRFTPISHGQKNRGGPG